MKLKLAMMRDIETYLQPLADEKGLRDKMVVADINFVCEDQWMFDLLSKRGSAIKNMDFSQVKIINQ